ncbi:MAG: LPS export ABC transporter periplasmic protein LptC [Methylophilaceae bacterium]
MLNRTTILFPMILAGLMALFTFWIYQTVEEQASSVDGSNRHDPDYTMDNFVTTQTDASGKLRYVLAAAKMVHYPDDDTTVLEQPKFTQYATDKPYTKIEGQRANVSPDGEEIEIFDDVVVIREAFGEKGEMQVLTDKLTIFPNQDLAKTDRPVVIKQAPKTVIHATGMIYDKKKKTMQLFKRVNAHYEKPKNKKR